VWDVAGEDPVFLGSCAAVGLPTFFVTAGHCVTGHEVTTLAVKHFGNTTRPLSAVVRHAILEERDIAVMEVEVEDASRSGRTKRFVLECVTVKG
jgi:hypothetical protein